jgi:hypothetical protein
MKPPSRVATVKPVGCFATAHLESGREKAQKAPRESAPAAFARFCGWLVGILLPATFSVVAPVHAASYYTDYLKADLEGRGMSYRSIGAVAIQGRYAYVGIERWVVVVDVSDPRRPLPVGYTIFQPDDSSWQASRIASIAVAENCACLVYDVDMHLSGHAYSMVVVDISTPAAPRVTATYEAKGGWGTPHAFSVAASGHYAYLYHTGGLDVVDLSNPTEPRRVAFWRSHESDSGWLGRFQRLVVAELSDPKGLTVLGSTDVLPCKLTDVAVAGNQAFVAGERGGVRVLDISNPKTPKEIGAFPTDGAVTTLSLWGHYVFAGEEGALHVLDASDPKALRAITTYSTAGPGPQPRQGEMVVRQGKNKHEIVVQRPGGPAEIIVHRPCRPPEVAVVRNHLCVTAAGQTDVTGGAAGGAAPGVAPEPARRFTEAETVVRILDFSTPAAPREESVYVSPPRDNRLWTDGARLAACGRHLLVHGYGESRLRVIDLSCLAWKKWMPGLVAMALLASVVLVRLALVSRRVGKGHWWLALLAAALPPALLLLVPRAPREAGHCQVDGNLLGMAAAEPYVYLVGVAETHDKQNRLRSPATAKLWVMDVSKAGAPREVGSLKLSPPDSGAAWDVTVIDNYAYVAASPHGLQVVDVSKPAAPKLVGSGNTPALPQAIAAAGRHAFVAAGRHGLRIFDVSNPAAPKLVGLYDAPPAQWRPTAADDSAKPGGSVKKPE